MDTKELRERQVLWVLGELTGDHIIQACGIEPGSFYRQLIIACSLADQINLLKLSTVFPNTAQAVQDYKYSDLVQRYKRTDADESDQ
jgi:hypothetical protein